MSEGEAIREFNWAEERKRMEVPCATCGAPVKPGYIYYDVLTFAYCGSCFMDYRDLASLLKS